MKIDDKVKVRNEPISLLKIHANKEAEIIKKGFGNEWLVRVNGELWWAKGYDLVVVRDE